MEQSHMNISKAIFFTLNFKVSLSNGKLELSEIAFARQIGTIDALSSADSELFGLPDLTSACVPVKFMIKIHRVQTFIMSCVTY